MHLLQWPDKTGRSMGLEWGTEKRSRGFNLTFQSLNNFWEIVIFRGTASELQSRKLRPVF